MEVVIDRIGIGCLGTSYPVFVYKIEVPKCNLRSLSVYSFANRIASRVWGL